MLLDIALAKRPDDSELLFLRANVAVEQKEYDTAISLYRRILVREPDAERVRLELARTFFLKTDYDNADRQFRFARAGNIDDTVKANIDHFLDAINRLREWTVNFSLALAPDTNQNAATSAAQVNIFGLPFALDKNARKQSGIVLSDHMLRLIGHRFCPTICRRAFGPTLSRTDYSGGQLDGMTLSSLIPVRSFYSMIQDVAGGVLGLPTLVSAPELSPRLWRGRWRSRLRHYLRLAGSPHGSAGQAFSDDFLFPIRAGRSIPPNNRDTYILSPSSLFNCSWSLDSEDADRTYSTFSKNRHGRFRGYSQDLPFGFSAGFQAAISSPDTTIDWLPSARRAPIMP